jgi:hypothetical protein
MPVRPAAAAAAAALAVPLRNKLAQLVVSVLQCYAVAATVTSLLTNLAAL